MSAFHMLQLRLRPFKSLLTKPSGSALPSLCRRRFNSHPANHISQKPSTDDELSRGFRRININEIPTGQHQSKVITNHGDSQSRHFQEDSRHFEEDYQKYGCALPRCRRAHVQMICIGNLDPGTTASDVIRAISALGTTGSVMHVDISPDPQGKPKARILYRDLSGTLRFLQLADQKSLGLSDGGHETVTLEQDTNYLLPKSNQRQPSPGTPSRCLQIRLSHSNALAKEGALRAFFVRKGIDVDETESVRFATVHSFYTLKQRQPPTLQIEWRFNSWKCQAFPAWKALRLEMRRHPRRDPLDPGCNLEYTFDPCERGYVSTVLSLTRFPSLSLQTRLLRRLELCSHGFLGRGFSLSFTPMLENI